MTTLNFDESIWTSVLDTNVCDADSNPFGSTGGLEDPATGVKFLIIDGKMKVVLNGSGSDKHLWSSRIDCAGNINPKMTLVIRFPSPQQYIKFSTDFDMPTNMTLRFYREHGDASTANQTEHRNVIGFNNPYSWQVIEYNRPSQPIKEIVIQTTATENRFDDFEFHESVQDIGHDIALALDGSGSMNSENKWNAMVQAADIFHDLYKVMGKDTDGFGAARFRWDCATTWGDETTQQPAFSALQDDIDIPELYAADSPSSCTPIGTGVLMASSMVKSGANLSKHVLLLTDGKNNKGPSLATIKNGNEIDGLTLHTIGLGTGANIDPVEIAQLAEENGGTFRQTTESSEILDFFPQILSEMMDKSEIAAMSGNSATIAPGTDKAIFLIAWTDTWDINDFNLITPLGSVVDNAAPSAPGMTINYHPKTTLSAHAYFVVEGPNIDGEWQFSDVPAGAQMIAIEDLALKIKWSVTPQYGVTGEPIIITARILNDDQYLDGNISVSTKITKPANAQGEFIARAVQKKPVAVNKKGDANIRSQVISQIFDRSDMHDFDYSVEDQVKFEKIDTGVFQLVFDQTQYDGMYRFDLIAKGTKKDGTPLFARRTSRSVVLSTNVANLTDVTWNPVAGNIYALTITPVSNKGVMVGPFLAEQMKLVGNRGEKQVTFKDNLDGSYKALVQVNTNKPDPFGYALSFGKRMVPIAKNPACCKRVTVTLNRIKVLDDKETWFPSPGELVFDAITVPNGEQTRLMRRRVPESGVLCLANNESKDMNVVLFDGLLEEGATLDLSIGGTEFDWCLFFTLKDKMARYRRKFTGDIDSWAGVYTPNDEPNDPESLSDWQLWYTIDIK